MTERVLVTGSLGFLGKQVRHELEQRGYQVVGVDRPGSGAEVEQDLADPEFDAEKLARSVGPLNRIIHLAAKIMRTSSVDAGARTNLQVVALTPLALAEAWNQLYGPTHLTYCSSITVYAPSRDHAIDPENPVERPTPFTYGCAKALAERLMRIAATRSTIPYAIVRPGYIYGPGQHPQNAIPIFLRNCWEGKNPVIFGEGKELRDYVLVSDVAYCLIEASLRRASGPFNATHGHCYRLSEIAEACCKAVAALGGPSTPRVEFDLSKPGKLWVDQSFDIERARRLLAYEPTPLMEGLKCHASWLHAGAIEGEAPRFSPPYVPRFVERQSATQR